MTTWMTAAVQKPTVSTLPRKVRLRQGNELFTWPNIAVTRLRSSGGGGQKGLARGAVCSRSLSQYTLAHAVFSLPCTAG